MWESHSDRPSIEGVLFDFDGTLTRPEALDAGHFKEAIGCPLHLRTLDFVSALPSRAEQEAAFVTLSQVSSRMGSFSEPNPGAEELVLHLRSLNLRIGIFSRNTRREILASLENFRHLEAGHFDTIVCGDDSVPPKPDPAGILLAAGHLGVAPKKLLIVGDFIYDVESALQAGAYTLFLTNGHRRPNFPSQPDFLVESLSEVANIVESLLPLPEGKLPNHFLERFLAGNPQTDPSVLVGPAVGQDTAVVQPGSDEPLLVLKSDPITFTTDRMGYSAVVVNSNDIATSGGTPRWLLTTLLFPPDSNACQILHLMSELHRWASRFRLSLCGGHTEITSAVRRPVVVGQLIGTVSPENLIRKEGVGPGDHILLTKGIAIEGTSILAHQHGRILVERGLPPSDLEGCRRLLLDPGISILEEARIAAETGFATALHDVTEGGLATALAELSASSGRGLEIEMGSIPVLPETKRLCALSGIDPLGLIGSGSLLIVCPGAKSETLRSRLAQAGIPASRIGRALESGPGIQAIGPSGDSVPWPEFASDELSRVAFD